MKKNLYKMLVFILAFIVLGTCTVTTASPPQDTNAALTAVISTMVVSFFETQTAAAPSAAPTLEASLTPIPTATINIPTATFPPPPTLVINTVAPTIIPATAAPIVVVVTPNLASGCNNLTFIRDETIPDGTVLKPEENFTKIWKVQNTGTCPWQYKYTMVLVGGSEFGVGPTLFRKLVDVNQMSEISLNMDAPKNEGKYTAYWRMFDGENLFGDTLIVSFVVVK